MPSRCAGMAEKQVLVPGPDHPITISPADTSVTVSFQDRVIAKTDHALVLQESTYRPVYYLPLNDVDQGVLQPSSHATYCPYKGDASYYSLRDHEGYEGDDDSVAENAVWTYVTPYDAVAEIAGHVAFYPDKVDITAA
jgi:uncharacterized protein (DUF427 family)